jgi:Putative transmembrane protein (PGPGW)
MTVMKVVKITGGFALIGLGVVMLVTPGPGWIAIGLGLTLLASEYAWARHWRDRLREKGAKLAKRINRG